MDTPPDAHPTPQQAEPLQTNPSPSHTSLTTIQQFLRRFLSRIHRSTTIKPDEPNNPSMKKNSNSKKKNSIAIGTVVVLAGATIFLTGKMFQSSTKATTPADQRAIVSGPRATAVISRDFSFSITDDKGKEVTKLQYTLESAEIRDEIVVKGSRAVAVSGRTFLILNLKLVNSYDKGININARDYIRLVTNGDTGEQVAADIHNDPVNVQAISTKATRLGFPINDSDIHNVSLQVGEIKDSKEMVPLNF